MNNLPNPDQGTKWKRVRWRALVIAGTIGILTALIFAAWRCHLPDEVAEERQELIYAGLRMHTGQLIGSYPGDWEAQENAGRLLRALRKLQPPVNAWTNLPLVNGGKVFTEDPLLAKAQFGEIKGYLRANREALSGISAAIGRDAYMFPVDMALGSRAPTPHLPLLWLAAQTLSLESACRALERDFPESVQSIQAIGEVGLSLAKEPLPASYKTRLWIKMIQIEAAQRLVSVYPLTEPALAALKTCFEQEDFAPQYKGVLNTELPSVLEILEAAPESSIRNRAVPESDRGMVRSEGWRQKLSGLRLRDEVYYLKAFHELWDAAALSIGDRFRKSIELGGRVESQAKPKGYALSLQFLERVTGLCFQEVVLESRACVMRTALAIEQYRRRNNDRLPARLEDLAPEYLPEVSRNPVDGGVVFLRPLKTGYRLSVLNPARDLKLERPQGPPPRELEFVVKH